MRTARIIEKGSDVFAALCRELVLCQFILGRKITAVTAMQNDNTLNVIATAEGGIVCTIEISATLAKGEVPKDKHEIISQRGIVCDIVVDAQLKQDSIYVFADKNKKFTDVDFELYGLSVENIAIVRAAFSIAQNNYAKEFLATDKEIKAMAEKVKLSVKKEERQFVDNIRNHKTPLINLKWHKKTIEAMNAVYQSISTGKVIKLGEYS